MKLSLCVLASHLHANGILLTNIEIFTNAFQQCRFLQNLVSVYLCVKTKQSILEMMMSQFTSHMPTVALCKEHSPETRTTMAAVYQIQ